MNSQSFRFRSAAFLVYALAAWVVIFGGVDGAVAAILGCQEGAPCNDGNLCTTDDTCQSGSCVGDPVTCASSEQCSLGICDPTTGACVQQAVPDGIPCDDGSLCTENETCQGGVCGVTGTCPAGFTSVPAGCRKLYDIDASLLDNLDCSCDGTGMNRYNGDGSSCCAGDYGFHWDDDASAPPVLRVDVSYQAGINCDVPGRLAATSLNGTPVGNAVQPGTCDCFTPSFTVTQPNVDRSVYLRGLTNSFSIAFSTCDGLSGNGPFGQPGLYAQVTVTYQAVNVDCDDGNACTSDSCDPATGCVNTAVDDGAGCDDGDACTQIDDCRSGTCVGADFVDCITPPGQCFEETGTCAPATGVCSYAPKQDGAPCDDGNACTSDACAAGSCTGTPVPCAPAGPCQQEGVCDPTTGSCSYDVKPDGTLCDDGIDCTAGDTCQAGACIGTTFVCAPPDQCHVEGVCNPTTGSCSYDPKPDGTTCDDGNPCTSGDSCLAGACAGNLAPCPALGPCNDAGVCDPSDGRCFYTPRPEGATCNDGNACTSGDSCRSGSCTGDPIGCADPDQCHEAGVCNPTTGTCDYDPKPDGTVCSDGNGCSIIDTCQGGTCAPGSPRVCDPPGPCSYAGTCNPSTGACVYPPKPTGTPCDDGNACTTGDACGAGVCVGERQPCAPPDQCQFPGECNPTTGLCSYPPKPNGTACSDGNACTTGDKCQSGTCTSGTSAPCASPDACHTAGTCNPTSGCTYPEKPNGTSCNDNNSCTTSDKCQSGTCTGTPKTCTAPDACHDATCNPSTGYCTYPSKPNGATCSDGNACTTGDACQSGTCRGNAVTCVAPDACHTATCNTTTGACTYPSKPNGTSCNDGSACTTSDKCQSGTCTGTPKTCTPPDSCHSATCNPSTGSCSYPAKSDGAACSDGNACTTGDACQAGTCRTTGTVTCAPPADQCHTQGTCNTSTGVCSNPSKANGTACNDGIACTSGDACSSGACAGAAPQCPTGSIDADTTVRQSSAYQNFGSSRELDAGNSPASVILVKVRVNGTSAVTGATLRLFVRSGTGSSAGSIHAVPCSWTEYGANWNNRPQLGPVLDTKGTYAPNQAVDFNVSSVITGPGTYCFGIDDPSGNYKYNSKEAISFGGRPVLLLATSCSCSP